MTIGRVFMIGIRIVLLWVIPLFLVSGCVFFHSHSGGPDLERVFGDTPPRYGAVEVDGRVIHFAETGDPENPMVLFIHGSPGAWHNFARFLADPELQGRAHLVSVDRPGFGNSGRGRAEPSVGKQAAALVPVLDGNRSGKPALVIGHSYGGPVAARLAMDVPDRIGGVILVAPSIDPALERISWYQHAGDIPPIRWMLPSEMDASNQEVLPLRGELEGMLPRWTEITAPVTVIQGERDVLVDADNAGFAERMLENAPVTVDRIPDANHFIPWSHPNHIRSAVLAYLDG